MRRRNFVAALGAATISPAFAKDAPKSEPPAPAARRPTALFTTSAACIAAGHPALAQAALRADTAAVARSLSDAIAACAAVAGLAALDAPFAPAFARTVGDLCRICKRDCDRFPAIKEFAAMSAACGACAEACGKA